MEEKSLHILEYDKILEMLSGFASSEAGKELCRKLRAELDRCLDAREARIIRLRYGLDGAEPMTQLETAQACRISRSYVSRLEKRALEKLRAAMERQE